MTVKYAKVLNGRELKTLALRYANNAFVAVRHVEIFAINSNVDLEMHVQRVGKARVRIFLGRGMNAAIEKLKELIDANQWA